MEQETADQLRFRIRVAGRVLMLFREALEANGNLYHGGMVPNLTSVTDIFVMPYALLQSTVYTEPVLNPDNPEPPRLCDIRPRQGFVDPF